MTADAKSYKVPAAQMPILEALWAAKVPMTAFDLLEPVNVIRIHEELEETNENALKVALSKMRDAGLINVQRPDAKGDYAVVTSKALEAALKTRDGKTRYGAAVTAEQIAPNNRKTRPTDEATRAIWQKHAASIHDLVSRPIFGEDPATALEPYSLLETHVAPLAYRIAPAAEEVKPDGPRRQLRDVVDLKAALSAWVDADEPEFPVLILSGDAGCGKSSFARIFAHELNARPDDDSRPHVLYVPLQYLGVNTDVRTSMSLVAKDRGFPPDILNPGGPTDRTTLLIFDGLDELANQGGGGATAAMNFAKGVNEAIALCRGNKRRLLALLCGRPPAAQHASDSFRDPQQTYHLIPFRIQAENDRTLEVTYRGIDKATKNFDPTKHDQRGLWWAKYAAAYNETKEPEKPEPSELPKALDDKRLDDFTAQPLLLLLLAITFRGHRVPLDTSNLGDQILPPNPFRIVDGVAQIPERMADLYSYLLASIYVRDMARQGYSHTGRAKIDGKPPLDFVDFRDLLGILGLAAWHAGSSRVATVKAVEKLADLLGLTPVLQTYKEAYRVDTVALFVSFYFRHVSRLTDGEETFEFTVKPFGEALAASGLASALLDMTRRLGKRKDERRRTVWTITDLLAEWYQLTGPAELTPELLANLTGEIGRRVEQDEAPELGLAGRKMLIEMLNTVLPREVNQTITGGFPTVDDGYTHVQRVRASNRAEYTILGALSACTKAAPLPDLKVERPKELDDVPSWDDFYLNNDDAKRWLSRQAAWMTANAESFHRPHWTTINAAAEWIRRLRPSPTRFYSKESPPPPVILDRFDLSGQFLVGVNLDGARLDGARLDGARLDGARLYGARLYGARLYGASFRNAILTGATYGDVKLDTPEGKEFLRSKGAIVD